MISSSGSELPSLKHAKVWPVQTKRGLNIAKKDSETLPVVPQEITLYSNFCLLTFFLFVFRWQNRCSYCSSCHVGFKHAAMQPCRLAQLPTFMLIDLMMIFRGFDIYFKKMSKCNKTTYFWYLFPFSIMLYFYIFIIFKYYICAREPSYCMLSLIDHSNVVVSIAPSWSVFTSPDIILSTELQFCLFIPQKFFSAK